MPGRSLMSAVVIHALRALLSVSLVFGGWSGVSSPSARPEAGAPQWRLGHAPLPPEVEGVGHLSCPNQNFCLAIGFTAGIGSVVLRSADGGLRWSEISEPAGLGTFVALDCADASHCLATTEPGYTSKGTYAGGVALSTDGGLTWHADHSFPRLTSGYLGTVSCVTALVCYVFNSEASSYLTGGIERTADFGGHWTAEHVSGPHAGTVQSVHDASCPTTSSCVAVVQWTRGGKASPLLETSNGGLTWTIHVAPTKRADLIAVSCGSARDCLAAGGGTGAGADVVFSEDGGLTWKPAGRLLAVGTAWAITCPSARSCLVAGQAGAGDGNNGATASTTDLGQHWAVTRTARNAGILDVASCPTAEHCVTGRESSGGFIPTRAGANGFFVSGDAGASWRKVDLPLGLAELQGASCTASGVCYAVGGTSGPADDAVVLRSGNGGNSWRVVLRTGRFQTLSSISCPTAAQCVAVGTLNFGRGNGIARTVDGGRSWRVSALPAGVADLRVVSCPTIKYCEAIGDAASGSAPARLLRSADGGQRWEITRPPRGVSYLLGLSCASGRVCTAVGDGQRPLGPAIILRTTDAGQHWTPQEAPRGATILASVSCPSVSACDAFSETSPATIDATRDGGARWTVQKLSPHASEAILPGAISCVTSRSCAGVALFLSFGGAIFQTANGKTWQDVSVPGGVEWMLGVSCTRRGCVAVGLNGEIAISQGNRPA